MTQNDSRGSGEELARHKGWCECLDAVVASLKDYPHGGGDIGVMTEVERIVKEAK